MKDDCAEILALDEKLCLDQAAKELLHKKEIELVAAAEVLEN